MQNFTDVFSNCMQHVRCFQVAVTMAIFFSVQVYAQETGPSSLLLYAARVFDGNEMHSGLSVLVKDGRIARIGPRHSFKAGDASTEIDLGDATLLPGFIELHAHLTFQKVPVDIVLRHGVTTVRDVGGPVHQPYGGDGSLRVLTSGQIITAPHGYPIITMGARGLAIPVTSEAEAREAVRHLIGEGAVVIKIALEPGGEAGAPWSPHHGHAHHDTAHTVQADSHHHAYAASHGQSAWPMLSEPVVRAIVDEAHRHQRKVSAHVAESSGVQVALNAGVDEWAHMPCDLIPEPLLKQARAQNVTIIGTLDTLSKCDGIAHNAAIWAELGGELLYGAEIAHPDIPWGIDVQELMYLMHLAKMKLPDALRAATAKAGQYLGIPLLGTIQPGAPADLIAIRGNLEQQLKRLEYPDLVISGGQVIVNHFGPQQ
ncbi:amidohydrolase family protein [Nitrosomonas eutropha]|uniref:amidohydrolase family protein n=1 Tax=Nitrosomonas eutropha TaxID=916 RepID=UPI00088ABC1B|nr:amidohydrolase family protein [Nitrosomonas eutropha]SCX22671.1 Imidazolonepropionase [Nitrosomonas eutropha]SEJ09630.1 Imidazolonepropionase [Nitrosomonas eutropha]